MSYPCVVWGGELEQVDTVAACTFCGRETPAAYLCAAGHHICEECQLTDWPQVVERVCVGTGERDPVTILRPCLLSWYPARRPRRTCCATWPAQVVAGSIGPTARPTFV